MPPYEVAPRYYYGSVMSGCACGALEWPCPDASQAFADYSNCHALHAEANAIAYASRADTEGATLYLTYAPCDACSKLVRAAGITRVVVEGEGD
jgi:deoxycytidylate deaminase